MNPTPEQLAEMYAWYLQRQVQQISYPLDEASKNSLGALTYGGASSHTPTTTISIPSGGGIATVAVIPTGFFAVVANGSIRNVAFYT